MPVHPLTRSPRGRRAPFLATPVLALGLALGGSIVTVREAGAQTNVVVRSRSEEPAPTAKAPDATLDLPTRVSFNSPALRGLRTAAPGLLGDRRDRIDPKAPRLLELHRLAAIGRQPLLKRWHPGSTPFDNLTAPRTTTAPLLSVHVANSERWGAVVESGLSGGACACLAVTRPGRVPDGAQVPGLPVRVSRNLAIPPYLDIAWSASCSSSATDYAIYQGQAGSWTSHAPVTCSTGGALAATFAPGSGNRYFLVVPLTTEVEGSYGVDSAGADRPPSASACRSRSVAGVCP